MKRHNCIWRSWQEKDIRTKRKCQPGRVLPREWLQFPLTNHCSISVWTRKMGNWLQKHVARKIPHQNDKQHFMFYDISHIIMSCFWPFPYKLCILFDAYTQLENIQNEIDHIRFEMYRILTTSLEDWSEM